MWGSTAWCDNRRVTLPVFASATNISIENWSRSERKATRAPSGLSAGPTLRWPPSLSSVMRAVATSDAALRPTICGATPARTAACHSLDSVFSSTPTTSFRISPASLDWGRRAFNALPITSSPKRPAR